jgi:hypothetical protein
MTPKHTPSLQLRNSIHYFNLEVKKNLIYFTAAKKEDDGHDDDALVNIKPSIAQSL